LFNSQAAISQITYGDIILLNKADLVDEEKLTHLEARLREMKEGARILRSVKGEVPLPAILSVGLFESDHYFKNEELGTGKQELDTDHADHDHEHDHADHSACDHDHNECVHDHAHNHDHHHSNHLEEDGFTSVSFQSDRPFDIKKFQHFLDHQLPASVFRAKGILWFQESPKRHIFHLSGKRFSLDDDEWKGKPKTQVVLIGQALDHDTLLAQIQHCIGISSEHRGKGFGK